MSVRSFTFAFLAVSTVVLAACSSDDDSSSGGGDFCEKTIGVALSSLDRCCTAEDKKTTQYQLTAGFAPLIRTACTTSLSDSMNAGRIKENAADAQACYDGFAKAFGNTCTSLTESASISSVTACKTAYVGTVQNGGGCKGDYECVDGLTCVGYTSGADGKCVTPPAVNEPCGAGKSDGSSGSVSTTAFEFGSHPQCATGAHCDDFDHVCVAGEVTKDGTVAEGGDCTTSSECNAGYCTNDTRKCAKKKVAGSDCSGGSFSSECIGVCNDGGKCASYCGSM